MTLISQSEGRFTAGVVDLTMRQRQLTPGMAPVVYCAGTNASATSANNLETLSGVRRILRHLAGLGYPVVAPTATNLWGNATNQARITDAVTYAETNMAATGPAVLIGHSQGGLAALSWAMNNPADTACVIGLLGAVDLNDIRDDDDAGQRDDIDAAYGVTYPAALPAGVNPADRAAEFQTIPTQWWYANDDALVDTPTVTAFAATAGTDLHDLGALGHTNTAILAVDLGALTTFVEANT